MGIVKVVVRVHVAHEVAQGHLKKEMPLAFGQLQGLHYCEGSPETDEHIKQIHMVLQISGGKFTEMKRRPSISKVSLSISANKKKSVVSLRGT